MYNFIKVVRIITFKGKYPLYLSEILSRSFEFNKDGSTFIYKGAMKRTDLIKLFAKCELSLLTYNY